jgi:hypothetical protein
VQADDGRASQDWLSIVASSHGSGGDLRQLAAALTAAMGRGAIPKTLRLASWRLNRCARSA